MRRMATVQETNETKALLSTFISLLLCENHSVSALMDFKSSFQSCGAFSIGNIFDYLGL